MFLDCWGAGPDFPLLDPPPAPALASAQATLKRIGATQELALLPTDPRLGASLLRHGSQAAPIIASLADAPLTPDLTRHRPPQREVKRLARLVEDLGPADSGEVVATAFPEQVAKRMGEDYLLASGTARACSITRAWPERRGLPSRRYPYLMRAMPSSARPPASRKPQP